MEDINTHVGPKYVKIRIEDIEGNVLLHHFLRIDRWDIPAGRIEEGETSRFAATRELLERTGFEIDEEKLTDQGVVIEGKNTFALFAGKKSDLRKVAEPGERGGYKTEIIWSKSIHTHRCSWANTHELLAQYHDEEWGVPVHDDRLLFEMLNLEGAQAGLSWLTVLKKRDAYRKAFKNFDAKKLVVFTDQMCDELMKNDGIIRNRLKIRAVVENAKAYLNVSTKGSFDSYIWSFSDGKIIPHTKREEAIELSKVMSKDLLKRGFKFVGPTICFAYMQAIGMVNDHEKGCFRCV
jgi:DNA-3-methyladenine glycosylase I